MYRILLPVDSSEKRAAAQAATAADLPGASESITVHLLHVFERGPLAEATDPTETPGGEVAKMHLDRAGVDVEELSRHGDPATEIVRAADEIDADLILLGGRKRSPLGSAVFGSVSQAVTLESDVPVVITGGREKTGVPSHRCRSCGEEYFTRDQLEIRSCRNCGGTKVDRVTEGESPPVA